MSFVQRSSLINEGNNQNYCYWAHCIAHSHSCRTSGENECQHIQWVSFCFSNICWRFSAWVCPSSVDSRSNRNRRATTHTHKKHIERVHFHMCATSLTRRQTNSLLSFRWNFLVSSKWVQLIISIIRSKVQPSIRFHRLVSTCKHFLKKNKNKTNNHQTAERTEPRLICYRTLNWSLRSVD